jgi:cysteine-rich repeat protein
MRFKTCMMSVVMVLAGCSSDPAADGTETGTRGTEDSGGESGSESGGETNTSGTTETSDTTGDETAETTGPPEPFCGDGNVDPGEECDDGNDNSFDGCLDDCTAIEPLDPPAMQWEYMEVPGTRCMNGSTAGFGINYNPDSPNVMIYLEGGGACFSDACDFTAFSIPFVPPIDGIFSRSNNANPVKDWTMVYVPYCTGDIHAGDAEAMLGGQLRQFRGYSNITRYLELLVPSFPAERVLLTGISAGGFGSALNATQVADAYGEGVELTVIDDSGPPLSNAVIPPCLQTLFRETWNLDGTVLANCDTCDPNDFATGLIDHVFENYPDIRFGLFSNTADQVISTYMGAGWGNGQYNNCEGIPLAVPPATYTEDLNNIRAQHMAEASTFYQLGLGHTALRVGFNITIVDGTSLPDWIGAVLDGQITHVGP